MLFNIDLLKMEKGERMSSIGTTTNLNQKSLGTSTLDDRSLIRIADKYITELKHRFKINGFESKLDKRIKDIYLENCINSSNLEILLCKVNLNEEQRRMAVALANKYALYIFQELFTPRMFINSIHCNEVSKIDDEYEKKVNSGKIKDTIFWNGALKEYCQTIMGNPAEIEDFVNQLYPPSYIKDLDLKELDVDKINSHWKSCISHFRENGELSKKVLREVSKRLTDLFTERKFVINFKSVFECEFFTGYCEDIVSHCDKAIKNCLKKPELFSMPTLEFCISHLGNECYLFLIIYPQSNSKRGKKSQYKLYDKIDRNPKCSVIPLIFEGANLKFCDGPEMENKYQKSFGDKFMFTTMKLQGDSTFLESAYAVRATGFTPITQEQREGNKNIKLPKKGLEERLRKHFPQVQPEKPNENLVSQEIPKESIQIEPSDSEIQNNLVPIENSDSIFELYQLVGQKNVTYDFENIGTGRDLKFRAVVCVEIGRKQIYACAEAGNKKTAKRLAAKNYLDGIFYVPQKKGKKVTPSTKVITKEKPNFSKSVQDSVDSKKQTEGEPLRFDVSVPVQIQPPILHTKRKVKKTTNPIFQNTEKQTLENSNLNNEKEKIPSVKQESNLPFAKKPESSIDSSETKIKKNKFNFSKEALVLEPDNLQKQFNAKIIECLEGRLVGTSEQLLTQPSAGGGLALVNVDENTEGDNNNVPPASKQSNAKDRVKNTLNKARDKIFPKKEASKKTHSTELESKKTEEVPHINEEKKRFPFFIPEYITRFTITQEMRYAVSKKALELLGKATSYKDIPNEPTITKVLVQVLNKKAIVFVIHTNGEERIKKLQSLQEEIKKLSWEKFNLENELERRLHEGKMLIKNDEMYKKMEGISESLSSKSKEGFETKNARVVTKILNLEIDPPVKTSPGMIIPLGCMEVEYDPTVDHIRISPASGITSFVVNHIGGKKTKEEIAQAELIRQNYLAEIELLKNKLKGLDK